MKTNNNVLDEMQSTKRNHIGHQMFMIMFVLILINCSLYGSKFAFAKYPADVTIIISACFLVYLLRVVVANAYLPPKAQSRSVAANVMIAIFAVTFAVALGGLLLGVPQPAANNSSAITMLIVSAVGLIILVAISFIQWRNNQKKDED